MYQCPACKIELYRKTNPFGMYWACPYCTGKAISISILRQAISGPIIGEFWRKVTSINHPHKKPCPACKELMSEVPLAVNSKFIEYLDICKTCYFIWFDPEEFEVMSKIKIPEDSIKSLPYKARLALAEYNIERIATQREKEIESEQTQKEIAIEILVVAALIILFK